MNPADTWRAILGGNRNIRFADLERLAEAFGFEFDRQSGSHRIWRHPSHRPARLDLRPDRNGQAKRYQIDQLVDIVEEFGPTLGQ
ncbi:type II toxin-antitoxin system HicA family toxin [Benzoatithermus flavus]|uniref:Type II toxin-antitoxin system HicA family toxin n=1 Tax=Benzoatithermus flavus TaxID=3108223 RepID=A0ABU8XNK3_9PROT